MSTKELMLFELWCWRRLLRVPWTARSSNQSILMEISPEYSFQGLMLKLKLQCFGHLMRRTDSLEKTLILRKIEGRRRRDARGQDGWIAPLTQRTWVWASSGIWWWTGKPGMLQSMGLQRVRHFWETELNGRMYVYIQATGKRCYLIQRNLMPVMDFWLPWHLGRLIRGYFWSSLIPFSSILLDCFSCLLLCQV